MGFANACKADMVKDYIGWAMKNGFGVIDVNMPKHITEDISVCFSLFLAYHPFRARKSKAQAC